MRTGAERCRHKNKNKEGAIKSCGMGGGRGGGGG